MCVSLIPITCSHGLVPQPVGMYQPISCSHLAMVSENEGVERGGRRRYKLDSCLTQTLLVYAQVIS